MLDLLKTLIVGKEKRTVLLFREDGRFKFEKKEVEDTFLVEKKRGQRVRAWKMSYKLQLPFAGYGKIPRDMVTICYARDIIFDPFELLTGSEKPDKTSNIAKPWITDIAESQGYTAQQESSKQMAMTTQMSLLGTAVLVVAIAVFIVIMTNMG